MLAAGTVVAVIPQKHDWRTRLPLAVDRRRLRDRHASWPTLAAAPGGGGAAEGAPNAEPDAAPWLIGLPLAGAAAILSRARHPKLLRVTTMLVMLSALVASIPLRVDIRGAATTSTTTWSGSSASASTITWRWTASRSGS